MRIGLKIVQFAVVVAVVASVTAAMAQGQRGQRGQRGGGGGFGISPLTLVQNEKVQKDLSLSEDQKTQITKLADEQQAQRGQGRRGQGAPGAQGQGPGQGGPNAFQQAQDELKKKIDDILLPPQQERFAQISLQVQNMYQALADEKVATKLSLTSEQKDKLTALTDEYRQKRMDLAQSQQGAGNGAQGQGQGGQGRRGGFGAPTPEMTALTTEENDKAKALLTSEQKATWDKLVGKKLDIDPAELRGRGGRGARGGAAAGQPNA